MPKNKFIKNIYISPYKIRFSRFEGLGIIIFRVTPKSPHFRVSFSRIFSFKARAKKNFKGDSNNSASSWPPWYWGNRSYLPMPHWFDFPCLNITNFPACRSRFTCASSIFFLCSWCGRACLWLLFWIYSAITKTHPLKHE